MLVLNVMFDAAKYSAMRVVPIVVQSPIAKGSGIAQGLCTSGEVGLDPHKTWECHFEMLQEKTSWCEKCTRMVARMAEIARGCRNFVGGCFFTKWGVI